MESFEMVSGRIAPMLGANIDTDVIMPKQFLKGIDRKGLDRGVFFDQRFLDSGEPDPDFVLNREGWAGATFLAVGPNFGCGSSREHAVWGLRQLGIRAIVGTSFAGIFFDNCQRNGLLLVELDESGMSDVAQWALSPGQPAISIDLPGQQILLPGKKTLAFDIDAMRKGNLLRGLDAIDSTLQHTSRIEAFEKEHLAANPWLR